MQLNVEVLEHELVGQGDIEAVVQPGGSGRVERDDVGPVRGGVAAEGADVVRALVGEVVDAARLRGGGDEQRGKDRHCNE